MDRWVRQLARLSGPLGQLVGTALVGANTDLTQAVVDALKLRDSERVLDIGCGPGQGIRAAFEAADVIVHAADPSTAMLARVRLTNRRAVRRLKLHLHPVSLDELRLVVPLEAAFGVNVVYFLDDLAASLGHLLDLMAPGGRVALGYRDRDHLDDDAFGRIFREQHHAVTVDEVEEALRVAGFTGVLTADHDVGGRITVGRRPGDAPPRPDETGTRPVDLTSL